MPTLGGDVTFGDVNGDGIEDMVFGGAVALGKGDGTFAAPTVVATTHIYSAAPATLADLNGDGNLDIIVPSYSAVGVAVFLGNGNGTFGVESDYPVDSQSTNAVAVADFNGDGKLDIATANNGSLTILLGKGDGTFPTKQAYATTDANPFSLTVGDYNGDGKMDAAVGNLGEISLFPGNGDGTFAAPTRLTGPSSVNQNLYSIATGDINGDGKLDLVLADSTSVGILFGNGNGTFQAVQEFSVAVDFSPVGVVVGDINGDGKPDIAVSSGSEISAAVLINNGNQTFQTTLYEERSFGIGLALADLNGDGIQDLALVSSQYAAIDIFLAQNTFTTSLAHVSLPGSGSDTVIAKYSGDTHFAGSTSNTLTLPTKSSSAGPYPTTTTLTAMGSEGSYQLNAAVIASGEGTPTVR